MQLVSAVVLKGLRRNLGGEEGSVRQPDRGQRTTSCERGSGFSAKSRDLIVFTLLLIYEGTHHFNITQPVMNKQYLISSLLS